MKQVIALLLSAALFAGCAGCKGGTQTEMKKQYDQAFYGTTASVDGKSFSPVSGYDGKKYVGMFYCLWNGDANETIPDDKTVYDDSRYEAETESRIPFTAALRLPVPRFTIGESRFTAITAAKTLG